MSGIVRTVRASNLENFSRRLFSSSAFLETLSTRESVVNGSKSIAIPGTVGAKLASLPSARLQKSLNGWGVNLEVNPESNSKKEIIKSELFKYVEKREYDTVVELLLHWAQRDLHGMFEILSRAEFAFIINQVIIHQYTLLQRYASRKPLYKDSSSRTTTQGTPRITDPIFAEAMSLTQKVRRLYSNILYSDPSEHIYGLDKRENLYTSEGLTGIRLKVADYENLILMELRNYKLDLASKWFQRFEKEYELKMSYKLYILKLQTYCGGLPSSWLLNNSDLSKMNFDPKQSKFKWEKDVSSVMADFYSENGDVKLDNEFNESLIYAIGYSKNIDYLQSHIYSVYGIGPTADIARDFQPMSKSDPSYPDINILTAVVVALSYNDRFNLAMKVVNRFQELYEIDTDTVRAKNFWQQLFKWCNLSNRHSEKSSLKHFANLSKTSFRKVKAHYSLESAKKDPNFDYEGYLEFIQHIANLRRTSFEQLWALYKETEIGFSLQVYKSYLKYLSENLGDEKEEQYYDYLATLHREFQKYNVDGKSFNTRRDSGFRAVSNISGSIYILYQNAIRDLIDLKWQAAYAGQCRPLIEKWALNDKMKHELTVWFETNRLPKYQEMIEKKREDYMVSLRTEETEDDSFLSLM
ncbi:mitochondrial ATPase expression-domain-containing protein [Scheffersomyces xylosifermentans]|uniref:mitochondrial ATPase expression-domain-containing protein n=1 Tax=Scheffersomyces xylosifermentans TaxID=1304137 RepID=UPI00315DB056